MAAISSDCLEAGISTLRRRLSENKKARSLFRALGGTCTQSEGALMDALSQFDILPSMDQLPCRSNGALDAVRDVPFSLGVRRFGALYRAPRC